MAAEHTTIIVSVNTEWDEEARIQHINKQVDDGWRVRTVTPISGGGMASGGASEDFLRLQVILERDTNMVDEQEGDVDGAEAMDTARETAEVASDIDSIAGPPKS